MSNGKCCQDPSTERVDYYNGHSPITLVYSNEQELTKIIMMTSNCKKTMIYTKIFRRGQG